MYFINIKQLKKEIINKDFTEKDRFIYMFIYIMGFNIIFALFFLSSYENALPITMLDYFDNISTVLITGAGTYYLFKANGGDDGEDFLGRYFSITWVVGIRLLLPYLILSSFIFIIMDAVFHVGEDILNITITVFFLLYTFLVYYCSYGHMVDVAKSENS